GNERYAIGRPPRSRRTLRSCRSPRHSRDARLDLLRCLGTLEQLEGGATQNFRRVAQKRDSGAKEAPERLRLAQRQRQSAAGRGREGLPGHRERTRLAESRCVIREGLINDGHWEIRPEDDWSLRIRPACLLARGPALWRRARL